jgi:hypothetical protein
LLLVCDFQIKAEGTQIKGAGCITSEEKWHLEQIRFPAYVARHFFQERMLALLL